MTDTPSAMQGSVNIWWESLKWLLRLSRHTLPALLLGVLEKLSNAQLRHTPEARRLIAACEALKHELKVGTRAMS